jgi:putative addiction module antidote
MTQKVLQIGSSAGITIPKEALKKHHIQVGDEISVEITDTGLSVKPLFKVEGELVEWTKSFIEKYRPALEALKDK